jgi:hypothetical protein
MALAAPTIVTLGYGGEYVDQRWLNRGSHRSVDALVKAIKDFAEVSNETAGPFQWTKTADEILASIARCAQRSTPMALRASTRTIGTGH